MVVRGEIGPIDGIKIKTGERIDDNKRELRAGRTVYRLLELNEGTGAVDDSGLRALQEGKSGNVRSCIDIAGRREGIAG